MNHYPATIQRAIKSLSRLPGVGAKTAERFAMHLLRAPLKDALELSEAIRELKEKGRICKKCFALSDGELCEICADIARDDKLICVVEQPGDMAALEKSGSFAGVYHILGGALSPMDNVGPGDIRIKELLTRIEKDKADEVVLATGTGLEGETTAAYISKILLNLKVKVTRIASGVPIGGDLKYVDQVTLKRAMDTRHDFSAD